MINLYEKYYLTKLVKAHTYMCMCCVIKAQQTDGLQPTGAHKRLPVYVIMYLCTCLYTHSSVPCIFSLNIPKFCKKKFLS